MKIQCLPNIEVKIYFLKREHIYIRNMSYDYMKTCTIYCYKQHAVVAIIGSLFPWLFPGDNGDFGGGDGATSNPVAGIKGNDFYGIRMLYTDETKATGSMVENYVELVENSIEEVENISTINNGGENYSLTLNINITLPDEDYDYLTFDETEFSSHYVEVYSIVKELSKIVYLADNGTEYLGTSLSECLVGIKYFGFANM